MKNLTCLAAASILLLGVSACNNQKNASADATEAINNNNEMTVVDKPIIKAGKYINLSTGADVYIIRDSISGVAIDSLSRNPVQFYYDPITLDTLFANGLVVNNMLINDGDGKYRLDDTKIKIDGDEIKIKNGDSKIKIDGDDRKIKDENGKIKVDDNEEFKSKDANGKVKIDEKGMKVKPSN
jgi:hypothetical protein